MQQRIIQSKIPASGLRLHLADRTIEVQDAVHQAVLTAGPTASGRPHLHPLRSPAGVVLTEDAPAHHPWQHGVYVGLNDIDGIGFWCAGLHAKRAGEDGRFRLEQTRVTSAQGAAAGWDFSTAWLAPDAAPVLHETQSWQVTQRAGLTILDLEWRLKAYRDLRFGGYDYGGLFVRMPWRDGMVVDLAASTGRRPRGELDGQPAWWLALALPLGPDGAQAGLALGVLAEHAPYPPTWRLDTSYGFGPARCRGGAWQLPRAAEHCERLRLVAFDGPVDLQLLAECYAPTHRYQEPVHV